ncbi:hypothetical protein scyTo_0018116 [Scyliorhinus torazame]|uniref:Secreted protein n=1 Tax=Scyliorhinus torazame TaxID=75743 RepID=A0A401Q4Z8_SCYTO|nr:hypothetical protein [Scyliorhinus torazame]
MIWQRFIELFCFLFSDSIGNNYSPAARDYSTYHIYKLLNSCESLELQSSEDPEYSPSPKYPHQGARTLKIKSPRIPLSRRK